MKRALPFIIGLLTLSFSQVNAQISVGGEPLSFRPNPQLADDQMTEIELGTIDYETIQAEDEATEAADGIPRYGVHRELNIGLNNSGTWVTLPNGDRVWKLKLASYEAQAMSLLFSAFDLPKGGMLYIYSEDRTNWIGGFNHTNNNDGGNYATSLVFDDAIILEYYEPARKAGQGVIEIEYLVHAYRNVYPENADTRGGSQSCEVDVNCSPEGNNWQDEKKGVVRMSVVSNQGSGWCTASMVNNTSLDCTPYILTAMHCTENSSTNNFNQYTFYYNYETANCGSGNAPTNQTVIGCSLTADSDDNGGGSGSDYALLEANSTIPTAYNTYFNGWNAQTSASGSGVSIHHPAGDRKKISTYTSALFTTGWGANNTHWGVNWVSTANGHGVTEGGSSGSPIFDGQGRIVGTLTGGGSFCSQIPNPSSDAYGKMSYHWGSNPGDNLSDFLDPGNTGQLTLTGTYAPCGPSVTLDAAVTGIVEPSGATCATNITPVVTIQNNGSSNLTSVQILYNIDGGGNQTFAWSGNLSTNQSTNVTLPAMNVTAGAHVFNANTNLPNNGTDEVPGNNASSSNFSVVAADTYVTLLINTDDYGSETTWELTTTGGSVLYTGGPFEDDVNSQIIEELCVEEGTCYVFTIYDAEDDGICCDWGLGSYSLADAEDISITTGAAFGTSESTPFCVPSEQTGCDTLSPANFASPFFVYPGTEGYITGTNNFGDLAKAQEFDNNQSVTVYGAVFWIGAKNWASANTNSLLTMNLQEMNGAGEDLSGAVNTAPGTVLQSQTMSLERADTSGFFNYMEFNTPANLSSNYAIGLDFSALAAGDEIGVVSSEDGAAAGADLAWEQWSDGDWYSMNSAWNNASDGDFDLGIFPVVCSTLVGTDELESEINLNLFPNPTNGNINVTFAAPSITNGVMEVYNSVGQKVASESLMSNAGFNTFDLSKNASGVYTLRVVSKEGNVSKRFILN
ncbi:MAG: lysyl endopeptidase [Flavobacteriales bacterium]|jgi:lysyl endopeptidase